MHTNDVRESLQDDIQYSFWVLSTAADKFLPKATFRPSLSILNKEVLIHENQSIKLPKYHPKLKTHTQKYLLRFKFGVLEDLFEHSQ
jgi:hypothetical protein